jgi:hypothetical protein
MTLAIRVEPAQQNQEDPRRRLSAQTGPRVLEGERRRRGPLRHSLQLYEWEVPSPRQVTNVQFDPLSATTSNLRLRPGTRRAPWPMTSRFIPWLATSRPSAEVDFVRRCTVESVVRPMPVVPGHEHRQLSPEVLSTVRNQQLPGALTFDGSNQPLDHSNTAVLANRTEPLTNPSPTTPTPESLVAELLALVSDEMSWCDPSLPNGSTEKRPDRHRSGLLVEHGEAHEPAGVVIDRHGDPPAEGSALRQREGEPGSPETERCRDRRQVGVPDVIRPLGCYDARKGARHRRCAGSRLWVEHPLNGGRSKMQSGAAENLEPANDGSGALFVQPAHPGTDRSRSFQLLAAQLRVKVREKWAREIACRTPERTRLGHCFGRGILGRERSPSIEASQKEIRR